MERPKLTCWADFSDDDYSETEDLTPSADPNKSLLVEMITKSPLPIFHLKIENLPYTITRNEEIYSFLGVSDSEVTIRMQYKGKKFIGCALAISKTASTAIRIASKYGTNLNGRPILVYYRPNETSPWIPHKKTLNSKKLSLEILSLVSPLSKDRSIVQSIDHKPISRIQSMNLASPKQLMASDSSIIKALPQKTSYNSGFSQRKFVFK